MMVISPKLIAFYCYVGEMGSMTQLEELKLKGNFLDGFLPPEALGNQTRGILAYLR